MIALKNPKTPATACMCAGLLFCRFHVNIPTLYAEIAALSKIIAKTSLMFIETLLLKEQDCWRQLLIKNIARYLTKVKYIS